MFRAAVINLKASGDGTGIKAGLRGSAKSGVKLALIITETIGKRFGWTENDKLEVLIGEGEHHGLIRVRKNNSVGLAPVEKKGNGKADYLLIRLGHQSIYINRPETARWCQWVEVDGWLEIKLPRWASETGTIVSRAEPKLPQGTSKPARAGNSVTSSIMGDPLPGRSALDQRGGV